jgi:hypothetical protein
MISCPEGVIAGELFTKEKRQEVYGTIAGGSGSRKPEEYQRAMIVAGTQQPCPPTHTRINWRKHEMVEVIHPMKHNDGFDYTENFDGQQIFGSKKIWYNLKSVVGSGGSQTRTLRDECYKFVQAQLDYILKTKTDTQYFANIFDGDEAAKQMNKFNQYLQCLPEYTSIVKYVYVGDLRNYFDWLTSVVNEEQ